VKSLVVPVDGGEVAERAVPVAASLARRADAEVVVVLASAPGRDTEGDETYLGMVVDRFPTSVACRRILDLGDGDVAQVILEEAAAAPDAVVVMATHGRTSMGELVVGSIADDVLREATVPVVLVGPHCGPATDLGGRFVVAVDGSDRDEVLIDAAARWAAATSASAVAVHVVVPSGIDAGIAVGVGDHVARDAAEAMRRRGTLATDVTVLEANAASGIVQYAADHLATAVLIGHRRRGRIGRVVLGSQALGVVRHARCPVVVVPR
jgi:nucleotide-binding universal stress UspA family protein